MASTFTNLAIALACIGVIGYLVATNGDVEPTPLYLQVVSCEDGLIIIDARGASDGTRWSQLSAYDNGQSVTYEVRDETNPDTVDEGDRLIVRQSATDAGSHNVRIDRVDDVFYQVTLYTCS